jgi:hypothetical protein
MKYSSVAVKPTIDSVGNAFGPVGTSFTVHFAGTGFRAAVAGVAKTSFAATGSGVTFSNVNVENPSFATATVTIAADAAGGDRTVSVTVIPASGPAQTSSGAGNKSFTVQIPTKVVEAAVQPTPRTMDPTAGVIQNPAEQNVGGTRCGAYQYYVYELQDQNGNTITEALPVSESIQNFSMSPNPNGYQPTAQSGGTTNGVFWDLQFWGLTGNCPGLPAFSGSLDLKFFVQLNQQNTYNLTTVRHITATKNSSGIYSISATTTTP